MTRIVDLTLKIEDTLSPPSVDKRLELTSITGAPSSGRRAR